MLTKLGVVLRWGAVLVGVSLAVWAGAETAGPPARPAGPEAGPTWIQNREARVELSASGSTGWWVLTYSRWDEAGKQWRTAFQGKLAGLMKDDARMQRHREEFKVYYVFDNAAPASARCFVENGSAVMELRLTRGQVWMDLRVQILADTPFVLLSIPRQSEPGLIGHCSQGFAEVMTYIALDQPGSSDGVREIGAREHRGEYVTVQPQQYLAAYRPGTDIVYFIFCPTAEGRRIMFSPGGFQTAWLDAPYVLYAGEFGAAIDAAAAKHLATALHLHMMNLLKPQGGAK